MREEKLLYGFEKSSFYIKAIGHITASFCPTVKEKVQEIVNDGVPIEAVFIDLSECTYMDSTFMGLILTLHKLLKEKAGKSVVIGNPTEESLKLLVSLGINKLVTISEDSPPLPDKLDEVSPEVAPSAEFLLNAHQNLMELNEENRAKFSLVEKILKEEIKKKEG